MEAGLPWTFNRTWAGATVFARAFDALGEAGVVVHQKRTEIARLCALVAERRPRRLIEIGTAEGGSTALLALAAAYDAKIVTVDRRPFAGSLPLGGLQRVVHVRGESDEAGTRDEVLQLMPDCELLFIDGDHEKVERDFELYGPCVRAGGVVAFHDICTDAVNTGAVPDFWRRLVERNPRTWEIVETPGQKGWGIGVLFV